MISGISPTGAPYSGSLAARLLADPGSAGAVPNDTVSGGVAPSNGSMPATAPPPLPLAFESDISDVDEPLDICHGQVGS